MSKMVIAVGADHRGVKVKRKLISFLEGLGYSVLDVGTQTDQSCDHPDYAFAAGELVMNKKADRVVLICGTGHGMILAVNKVPGIMAILPVNEEHARLSRLHNDANGICFGADYMDLDTIQSILAVWLETEHLGGKYARRVQKILDYERKKCAI